MSVRTIRPEQGGGPSTQAILSESGLLGRPHPDLPAHDLNGTVDLALGVTNDLLVLQNEFPSTGEVIRVALTTGVQSYAFVDPTPRPAACQTLWALEWLRTGR